MRALQIIFGIILLLPGLCTLFLSAGLGFSTNDQFTLFDAIIAVILSPFRFMPWGLLTYVISGIGVWMLYRIWSGK